MSFNSERSKKSHNGTAGGDIGDELEEIFLRGLRDGFRRERRRMREMKRKKEEEEARFHKIEKMEMVIENQNRKVSELQERLEVEGLRIMSDLEEVKSDFNKRLNIERNLWEEKIEEMKKKAEAEEKMKVEAEEKRKAEVEEKGRTDAEVKRKTEAEGRRKAYAEAKRKAEAEMKRKEDEEAKIEEDKRKAEVESKKSEELETRVRAAELRIEKTEVDCIELNADIVNCDISIDRLEEKERLREIAKRGRGM